MIRMLRQQPHFDPPQQKFDASPSQQQQQQPLVNSFKTVGGTRRQDAVVWNAVFGVLPWANNGTTAAAVASKESEIYVNILTHMD
jgi:hypothetical protein